MTSPGKRDKHKSLHDLDLSHKRSRDRVRSFLEVIDDKGTERWLRTELDDACGQPNKPLGRLLRSCFLQVEFYSPRSNGWNEYLPNPQKIEILRAALSDAEVELQTQADEADQLARDIELGDERHRKMFPHRASPHRTQGIQH